MDDERFKALSEDPRYRLPSKKKSQTAVDARFKRLFTDDAFKNKASVDRYGRRLKTNTTAAKKLNQRFRLEDEGAEGTPAGRLLKVDGGSDSDNGYDEPELRDGKARDPAREGFSGSSSEEESSSGESDDEERDAEGHLADETAGHEQTESIPMGDVSRRLAVVNLDWDNIRAIDIMAVSQSFVPADGHITRTAIYPSEFGRERMEREEHEGPPRAIFASTKRQKDTIAKDEDSEEEEDRIKRQLLHDQATEGEEFDTAQLRQYQLERLRYFYAVVECDSESTAKALYDNMDGREYLTTANFFDLRFIPEETVFDDDARDECIKLPDGYRPKDFRTDALTHSKVRLTWDNDDTTRQEVQKRAFSRAEIDENDLQAYIGSDASDADSVASRMSAAEDRKARKREAAKAKTRAALGLPDNPTTDAKQDDGPVGDMQITFSSGLLKDRKSKGVFENQPDQPQNEESTRQRHIREAEEKGEEWEGRVMEESTRERYIRQAHEKRQKWAHKVKAKGKGARQVEEVQQHADENSSSGVQDDPFDDPFFNDPAADADRKKTVRKSQKLENKRARQANDEAAAGRRAELELLMADENGSGVQHFDMREIEKEAKNARKKSKKHLKHGSDQAFVDDFKLKTDDPRFKGLFESHEYAIDPTNPKFKNTDAMKSLLEEGRKKRRFEGDDDVPRSSKTVKAGRGDIDGLVARLKSSK